MKRAVTTALLAVLCFNCASVVHQTTQQVPVKSDPPGAAVTVACGDVYNDPKLTTPTTVTLHRKPDICTLKLSKENYQEKELTFTKAVSGWYWGNILIGGIVGLIVDAANGAMFDRRPKDVDVKLEPASGTN